MDDDRSIHEALRLDVEGHLELVSALSGAEALAVLAHSRVDVVLLDLLMPGMDGWEVFERIAEHRHHRPKVVFLTGVDSSRAAVAALKLGAEDWIVKPYDPSVLVPQLLRLLRHKSVVVRGGSLGTRGTIAVLAALGCGLSVEYSPPAAPADASSCDHAIDATRADSAVGLAAILREPPLTLNRLAGVTTAALHYISRSYADLNVERVADAVGLGPNRFGQIFKRDLRLSPRDYIARVRVEVVRQRLGEPNRPPLERLAEEVGFCDAPHLSRMFRRYAQTAPTRYRGNIQADGESIH